MSTYEDETVDSFYEDVEPAMNKGKTPDSIIMGDFNAKIGEKQVGENAVGKLDTVLGTAVAKCSLASRKEIRFE